MTIPKHTRRAKAIMARAYNIRCWSLSDNFVGERLEPTCTVWAFRANPYEDTQGPHTETVTAQEFLARELASTRGAKLTRRSKDEGYTLHIHSNLWYSFQSFEEAT